MNWKNKEGNEVHRQTIWAEHIRKERMHRADKETFSINPNNLRRAVLTEPISQRQKRFLDREAAMLETITHRLRHEDELQRRNEFEYEPTSTGQLHASLTPHRSQVPTLPPLPTHISRPLADAHKTPKERHAVPQTSAQEVGWLSEPLVSQPSLGRFSFNRKACELTKYNATASHAKRTQGGTTRK
eukprot:TRINITY_DN80640_c0_g1_i1.p1 TRINITY_DN80640_c0_g1~~TRINITY_DN80640_c0_g1_i1.p1  ORF type:complete len:194 (+),score=28.61 TRINITY_DN80640_c0_g1_i1:27-584(+)